MASVFDDVFATDEAEETSNVFDDVFAVPEVKPTPYEAAQLAGMEATNRRIAQAASAFRPKPAPPPEPKIAPPMTSLGLQAEGPFAIPGVETAVEKPRGTIGKIALGLEQKQADYTEATSGLDNINRMMVDQLYALHKQLGKPAPTQEEVTRLIESDPRHESWLGISPENVDWGSGPMMGTLTALGRFVNGLGQFMTSPQGIVEQIGAMTPARVLVMGKWTIDMLGGTLAESKRVAEILSKPDPTDQDIEDLRGAIINTVGLAMGATALGRHTGREISKIGFQEKAPFSQPQFREGRLAPEPFVLRPGQRPVFGLQTLEAPQFKELAGQSAAAGLAGMPQVSRQAPTPPVRPPLEKRIQVGTDDFGNPIFAEQPRVPPAPGGPQVAPAPAGPLVLPPGAARPEGRLPKPPPFKPVYGRVLKRTEGAKPTERATAFPEARDLLDMTPDTFTEWMQKFPYTGKTSKQFANVLSEADANLLRNESPAIKRQIKALQAKLENATPNNRIRIASALGKLQRKSQTIDEIVRDWDKVEGESRTFKFKRKVDRALSGQEPGLLGPEDILNLPEEEFRRLNMERSETTGHPKWGLTQEATLWALKQKPTASLISYLDRLHTKGMKDLMEQYAKGNFVQNRNQWFHDAWMVLEGTERGRINAAEVAQKFGVTLPEWAKKSRAEREAPPVATGHDIARELGIEFRGTTESPNRASDKYVAENGITVSVPKGSPIEVVRDMLEKRRAQNQKKKAPKPKTKKAAASEFKRLVIENAQLFVTERAAEILQLGRPEGTDTASTIARNRYNRTLQNAIAAAARKIGVEDPTTLVGPNTTAARAEAYDKLVEWLEKQKKPEAPPEEPTPPPEPSPVPPPKPPHPTPPAKPKIFSDEKAGSALDRLRKRAEPPERPEGGPEAGPVYDTGPTAKELQLQAETLQDVVAVGGNALEKGAYNFHDWTRAMLDLVGKEYARYFKEAYNQIRDYTEASELKRLMSSRDEVEAYEDRPNGIFTYVAGREPELSGTVRAGGYGERPGIRVVDEGDLPAARPIIRAGQYKGAKGHAIDETQRIAINQTLTAFQDKKHRAFLLGDGTGVGKTGTELVIAAETAKSTDLPSLIVTQNKSIIENRFKEDAGKFGVDISKVQFATYDDLSRGKIPTSEYGVVIFDEAHNLKNIHSARSFRSSQINARHRVFATATPMDSPTHAAYFLAELTGKTQEQIANRLGYKIVKFETPEGEIREKAVLNPGSSWAKVIDNIKDERRMAVQRGQLMRREYPFFGTANFHNTKPFTATQATQSRAILDYWDRRIDTARTPTARRNYAGQKTLEYSRWLEFQKAPEALEAILKDIEDGKQVVVFAEGYNDTLIKGLVGLVGEKDATIPGTLRWLAKELDKRNIDYAKVFEDSPTVKASAARAFQKRKAKAVLATPRSGGAGLDFDDQVGRYPRSAHFITMNFSGDVFDQMVGRVSRRNTKSPAQITIWRNPQGFSDMRRQDVLDRKLSVMRGIQAGEDLDTGAFEEGLLGRTETKTEAITATEKQPAEITNFKSGSDSDALTTAYVESGQNVGVELQTLNEKRETQLTDYANSGGKIFVDSGAFTAFQKGRQLDFNEVMARYRAITSRVAPENRRNLSLVMPDVVGNQSRTLSLLETHKNEIIDLINSGVRAILPIQRGNVTLAEMFNRYKTLLGTDRFTIGIPSKAEVIPRADILDFLKREQPNSIHFLGLGEGKRNSAYLKAVRRILPDSEISADATWHRKLVGKGMPITEARRAHLEKLLEDSLYEGEWEHTEWMAKVWMDGFVPSDAEMPILAEAFQVPVSQLRKAANEGRLAQALDEAVNFDDRALLWSVDRFLINAAKKGLGPLATKQAVKTVAKTESEKEKARKTEEERQLEFEETEGGEEALVGKFGMPLETQERGGMVRASEINEMLANLMDRPIRIGGITLHKAAGIFRPDEQIARLRVANDIEAAAHETAHMLERAHRYAMGKGKKEVSRKDWYKTMSKEAQKEFRALDYDPKQRRIYEGWAEFMREYLSIPGAETRFPNAYAWFRDVFLKDNPHLEEGINAVRDKFRGYSQQGSVNRVKSMLRTAEQEQRLPWSKKLKRIYHTVRRLFEDDVYDIERIEREILGEGKTALGAVSPSKLARTVTQKSAAIAREWGLRGITDIAGNKVGPSLREIFGRQGIKGDELNALTYAISRRAMNLHDRGINPGIMFADARRTVEALQNPAREQFAVELTQFNDHAMQYLVDSGVISPLTKLKINKLNPIYVPFFRIFDKETGGGVGGRRIGEQPRPVRRIKGSGREIKDPLESMTGQMERFISIANKTRVARSLVNLVRNTPGFEKYGKYVARFPAERLPFKFDLKAIKRQLQDAGIDLEEADLDQTITLFMNSPRTPKGGNIVGFWLNGRRQFFELDPELYRAIMALDFHRVHPLVDFVLGKLTRTTRLGATGINPGFTLFTNLVRDWWTMLNQSRFNPATGTKLWLEHLGRQVGLRESEVQRLWKATGGEVAQPLGLDRRSIRQFRGEVLANTPGRIAYNIIRHPWEFLREVFSITEAAPRLAEFETTLRQMGWKPGDRLTEDMAIEAANNAAEVTINFSRAGSWGRMINQAVAFHNPNIQGLAKFGRMHRRSPLQSVIRGTGTITAIAVLNWILNHKDEEWKNKPAWLKYGFLNWKIGDNWIRIPMPFEWWFAYGAMPIAALEAIDKKKPGELEKMAAQATKQLTPPPFESYLSPTAATPLVEVLANKSFYSGKPVEPQSLRRLPPAERYQPYTAETSKKIAQILSSRGVNVSPIQVEHVLRGETGGLYTDLIRATERAAGLRGAAPIREPADLPIVGRIFARDGTSAVIDEMYDQMEHLMQKKATAKFYRDRGETGWEKYELNGEEVGQLTNLQHAARRMTELRKEYNASVDRAERRRIFDEMTDLAKNALD